MCPTVELVVACCTRCMAPDATPRNPIRTPSARTMQTDTAPSQNATRWRTGRGREYNSALVPSRTGSIVATSANISTVHHMAFDATGPMPGCVEEVRKLAPQLCCRCPGWPRAVLGLERALNCTGAETCRYSLATQWSTEWTVSELVESTGGEIGKFGILSPELAYDAKYSAAMRSLLPRCTGSAAEGGSVLLPLGSPLPDDAVVAARAKSGMLGGVDGPAQLGRCRSAG